MNIYTVGQINAYIKNMFSQDYFLHRVIVSGEVSNLKYHSSGHIYFTMKDESGILSAVMFRTNAARMTWKMENGDRIEATGQIGTYEKAGSYQLYVSEIKKAGAGQLHEQLELLKKKLSEMGMFDPMYKKSIPKYAFTIGVVTSPTGSVIHDIRQVAKRRNPAATIVLEGAKVQGEGAAQSIISGMNALINANVDVIIIGRGGGSEEDLSAFNDEDLAHAIFDCKIPVISAVGHGDDLSITDMVADAYAPTPSAAAEMAVFEFDDLVKDVNMYVMSLEQRMQKHVDRADARLKQMMLRMEALSPSAKIALQRMSYKGRCERLEALMERHLAAYRHKMNIYLERYKALSPVERIGHGFAAVTDAKGNRVTDITKVKKGDLIKLTMREGFIEATANRIEKRQ